MVRSCNTAGGGGGDGGRGGGDGGGGGSAIAAADADSPARCNLLSSFSRPAKKSGGEEVLAEMK